MYGLPKIHKQNALCCPILSMISSAQHELAKFLAALLQPVLNHSQSIAFKILSPSLKEYKNSVSILVINVFFAHMIFAVYLPMFLQLKRLKFAVKFSTMVIFLSQSFQNTFLLI